jgi:type VI secretion system ImpA/VasJ family protein
MADLIEEIRKPIPQKAPCGIDLEDEFDEDYTAFKTETDKLSSALTEGEIDWNSVVDLSQKILANKSKDMRVAGYLCLGLLKRDGLVGLAEGLEAYQALLEEYWDGLFPPLRIRGRDARKPPLDFLDERASKLKKESITSEDRETLQNIIKTIEAINQTLKGKLQGEPEILPKLADVIQTQLSSLPPIEDDEQEVTGTEIGEDLPLSASTISGPIRSRESAYQQLSSIADYLEKIEPHSPTPYLVRRAVSWGEMSLAELLKELVGDNPANLKPVYSLLGIEDGTSSRNQPPGGNQPASRNQPPSGNQPANRSQSPSTKR